MTWTKIVPLFIAFFQDTTLVTIVGMLDFLSTGRAAMHDPNWQGIAVVEGYVLAGFVYLLISGALGLYGRFLERIDTAKRRQQPSHPTATSARTT